jgi:2-keto-4-pentenoate hydratase/2-oxohepta-3-ene-1,7-dioic acid hydratase in catechol pathway
MKIRCLVNGETVQDSSINQMGRGGSGTGTR